MKLKSKNSFLKRISCIALSLMLCLTSFTLAGFVPTVEVEAATSNIDSDKLGLVGEYFINDATTGISSTTGTVNWDNTNGAYFDGNSYVTLSGTPFKYINRGSGFTISFDVKKDGSTPVEGNILNFGNTSDRNKYLVVNGGNSSTTNWTQYRFSVNNGQTDYRGYWLSDMTPSKGYAYASPTDFKEIDAIVSDTSKTYHFDYVMNVDGTLSVYIDNVWRTTFKPNYATLGNGHGITDEQMYSIFADLNRYCIGGNPNGEKFKGYLKNVRLYSRALSSDECTSGNVKTNSSASSIEDITVYSANNPASEDNSYSSSTNFTGGDEYKNVIYTYGVGANALNTSGSKDYNYREIRYGDIVFLYTGADKTYACPVNTKNYRWTWANKMRLTCPTGNDNFQLKHYWHGRSSTAGYQADTKYTFGYSTSNTRDESEDHTSEQFYSNSLYYVGALSDSDTHYRVASLNWLTRNDNNKDVTLTHNASLGVINYLTLINSKDTINSNIKTVNNNVGKFDNYYTKETLNRYYSALYNLDKLDPNNKFIYGSSYAYYSTEVAGEAIKAAVTELKNAYSALERQSATITFNDSNGNYRTNKTAYIGNTVTAPSNSSTTSTSTTHTTYSWPTISVITGDETYTEIAKTEKHTNNGKGTQITSTDDKGNTLQKHQTTCSICNAEFTEFHNFEIDSEKKATCHECGYSVSSDYKPNGFRITKGNLFDFDAYASKTTSTQMVENRGTSNVDIVNDTITVAGSARDAYTYHSGNENCYTIPIIGGNTYTFSYVPSKGDNQAFVFFYNNDKKPATLGVNYQYTVIINGVETPMTRENKKNDEYYVSNYSASPNSECKIRFTAPADCTYVDFRFGTVESGSICTFSNISFYESDENGNPVNGYEVLKSGAQNGDNVLSSAGIPSESKCKASYAMYKKSDAVGKDDLVTTNLNIKFDTEHNYSNQGISGDKATVLCSKCGHHYELDYSAYKAELTILQDKLADTDRYTPSSIEAATKAMNDVIANVRKPLTKEEVDVLVNDLKDAENSLVVNKFTLTFNVYLGEDKKELKYTKPLNDVPYGDSRLLSLPETYQTGYAVTKWTRTIKSSDSIIGTTTSSLTIIANSDASYNVFIKSTADPVDTKMVTATLNNKSNKVVDVAYVNKGINTVSINNSSITLTNGDTQTTLTAPSYSFYYVSGFTVNGLDVYNGSSVEINDTTVIRPIYDVNDRFTVVLDTNVKTNKGETGSVEKGWDERITVTADDADENTQWLYQYLKSDGTSYSKAEVIGYGKTVSLQVTQSCKISYNNDQNAQPQVSMDYVSYNVYKAKTITAVGRYYLPENCTKVRAGVILKTSNKKVGATNTPSRDALLNKDNYKVTNKSGVFEATSFVNGTNQYAINFYSSSDYEIMYIGAVAYLTYTDANGEHTIYSDIATYEYKASAE